MFDVDHRLNHAVAATATQWAYDAASKTLNRLETPAKSPGTLDSSVLHELTKLVVHLEK